MIKIKKIKIKDLLKLFPTNLFKEYQKKFNTFTRIKKTDRAKKSSYV